MSKIILFQGDSITDAGRNREDEFGLGTGYPYQVAAKLGYENPGEYTFYNRAISGNRSVDVYARIKSDIINLKPDYMSMLVGVNDIWHEFMRKNGLSIEKYEMIYNLMLEEIRDNLPDIKMFILEPYAFPDYTHPHIMEDLEDWKALQKAVKEYAKAAARVAEKNKLPFVPLYEKFEKYNGGDNKMLFAPDGIHPSLYGHRLIRDEWLKAFAALK